MKKFLTGLLSLFFLASGIATHADTLEDAQVVQTCPPVANGDQLTGPLEYSSECEGASFAAAVRDIWSGYIVSASTNKYVGVIGRVTVPARSNFCSSSSWVGWVGLGGRNSGSLLQVGIAYPRGGNAATIFYEYLGPKTPNPAIYPVSYGFAPGSTVELKLIYLPATHSFTISAGYVGDTTPFTKTIVLPSGDTFYDGTTAEWVDERLSYYSNGSLVPTTLMDFGVVTWSGAKTILASGGYESLASGIETPVIMYDYPKILAQPLNGLTNSQAFNDYWMACDGGY